MLLLYPALVTLGGHTRAEGATWAPWHQVVAAALLCLHPSWHFWWHFWCSFQEETGDSPPKKNPSCHRSQ